MGSYLPIEKEHRCELCGNVFASEYAKNKHMNTHIKSLGKKGMMPRYKYDTKTGETTIIGVKSKADIF